MLTVSRQKEFHLCVRRNCDSVRKKCVEQGTEFASVVYRVRDLHSGLVPEWKILLLQTIQGAQMALT